MLTQAQQDARRGKMTGSGIGPLMTGNEEGIMRLYREMTDQATEDDIKYWLKVSNSLPVRLGSFTEPFNLLLVEEEMACEVVRRGEVAVHPLFSKFACTLDGFVNASPDPYVVEAKHVGGMESKDVTWNRYMPQCQWNMFVAGTTMAALSVIRGNSSFVIEWIARDVNYIAEARDRALYFLDCVEHRRPPIDIPPPVPAPPRMADADMTTSNEWRDLEWNYCETLNAAKLHASTAESLKKLVPADAKRAFGWQVEIIVNKRGSKTIKQLDCADELEDVA
jgi:YqaJ-like viral recombinase domain